MGKTAQPPTMADDLATLMPLMAEAGEIGLTSDEIQAATGWSEHRTVTRILDLGGRVGHTKTREKGVVIRRYFIKARPCT